MNIFKSVHAYSEFAREVKHERRYIFSDEIRQFLEVVALEGSKHQVSASKGAKFWRAQVGSRAWRRTHDDGNEWFEDAPLAPDRMVPPRQHHFEGRLNPKGIGYLYLTSDQSTAISEVRPWKGALVSVALFEILRDVRLVNLTVHAGKSGGWAYLISFPESQWDKLHSSQISEAVWADIHSAFSQPVDPINDQSNYVPTQIIAEVFLDQGFDGVVYRSALHEEGTNVMLFDSNLAELRQCHLFEVESITYRSKEAANAWFMKDGRFMTTVISNFMPIKK